MPNEQIIHLILITVIINIHEKISSLFSPFWLVKNIYLWVNTEDNKNHRLFSKRRAHRPIILVDQWIKVLLGTESQSKRLEHLNKPRWIEAKVKGKYCVYCICMIQITKFTLMLWPHVLFSCAFNQNCTFFKLIILKIHTDIECSLQHAKLSSICQNMRGSEEILFS